MLPKWVYGTLSHHRTKKCHCSPCELRFEHHSCDCCSQSALGGTTEASHHLGCQCSHLQSASVHKVEVLGGVRMNFPMYFQAFQKVKSFVAWTLVKTIFCVFKYWSETSFLQQSIHSSSIIICNRPVFPLHYLYNDSARNCYSRVSTQDTLVLMPYSAHTAQYDSFARLLVVFAQCYFRAQAKP